MQNMSELGSLIDSLRWWLRGYRRCPLCPRDHYLGLGYLAGSADLKCVCRLRGTPGWEKR